MSELFRVPLPEIMLFVLRKMWVMISSFAFRYGVAADDSIVFPAEGQQPGDQQESDAAEQQDA